MRIRLRQEAGLLFVLIMRPIRWITLAIGLTLACDNAAAPGAATEITVTPGILGIVSGGSRQLTATVRDGGGAPIPRSTVSWRSLNPTLVSISGTGLVHSVGPRGSALILATTDTLSDTVEVVVIDSLLAARTYFLPDRSYAAAISVANVAFVSQSDLTTILRVDLSTHEFTDTINVGDTPTEMAFNSTGTRLYVTNQYSGTISVINVANKAVVDEIPVGNRPFEVIVEPGDSILWTGKIDSLYGIRLSTKEIIARFQIGDVGNGVAIRHDTLLYVSTHTTGTVVEINLRTRTQGRTFTVGGIPQKLVVSPDGNELYIANESGYIQFWDLNSGNQIGSNLALPSAAYGLARRPSDGLLYATSAYFGGGYLYVIDPVARTLLHASQIGGSTRHVVFTTNGAVGLIPNEGEYEGGWVDFIK